MTIEKYAAWKAEQKHEPQQAGAKNETPVTGVRVLSLQIEEDDLGGDPYNRTGHFCLLDIKERERSSD
jgi:hypothetical protein